MEQLKELLKQGDNQIKEIKEQQLLLIENFIRNNYGLFDVNINIESLPINKDFIFIGGRIFLEDEDGIVLHEFTFPVNPSDDPGDLNLIFERKDDKNCKRVTLLRYN